MKQLERLGENICDNILRDRVACGESGLDKLDIPVTEDIPYKVVYLSERNAELVAVDILAYGCGKMLEAGENPLILERKLT